MSGQVLVGLKPGQLWGRARADQPVPKAGRRPATGRSDRGGGAATSQCGLYAALRAGSTDNRIPTAFSTARRVFSVGLPFGDSAR